MTQIQTGHDTKNYIIIIEYHPLIGSYELFNIEYPAKARVTLEVLNGYHFEKDPFHCHWLPSDFSMNKN